jgi:hypothetical protein
VAASRVVMKSFFMILLLFWVLFYSYNYSV